MYSGQGSTGLAPQTSRPNGGIAARESQITLQHATLESRVKQLLETVGHLESRLTPVLRPAGPSDPASNATPREALVAHAEHLLRANDALSHATGMLEDILNRLEV